MAREPNVARDEIFCDSRMDFVAQCECQASEFGLRKIVLQIKSFKLKFRENSHRVMVDKCYKSWVALHVSAREEITFFLEISTFSNYITRFPEIVARKSGNLQIMPWLMCREI